MWPRRSWLTVARSARPHTPVAVGGRQQLAVGTWRCSGGRRTTPGQAAPALVLGLTLRARRPEPFVSGAYEPVEAGERVCAFTRGGEVFVAVGVRDGAEDGVIAAPEGAWRDVLRGDERSVQWS